VLTGAAAGAPRARLAPCTRSTLNMAQQHSCSSVPPYTQRSTSCCFDTAVTSLPQTGALTGCLAAGAAGAGPVRLAGPCYL